MKSLLTRLLLTVAVALVPALAFHAYTEIQVRTIRQRLVEDEAQRLLLLINAEQQRILEGADQVLDVLGGSPPVLDHNADFCQRLTANIVARAPRYLFVGVIGLDGRVTCASDTQAVGTDVSDRTYFVDAMRTGGLVIGPYLIGRLSGKTGIPLAKPLLDSTGTVAGVAEITLSLDWLSRQLDRIPLPAGATAQIADRNGTVLARHADGGDYRVGTIHPEYRFALDGDQVAVRQVHGVDGRTYISAYAPPDTDPAGLAIAVTLDPDTTFAGLGQADRIGLILLIIGAALALLLTALLGGPLIRRPVNQLLRAAEGWSNGNLTIRTGWPHGRGEFGRLANAFDTMAEAQSNREVNLRESETRLRVALDAARMGIIEFDLINNVSRYSPEAAQVLGWNDVHEVPYDAWLARVHPDDQAHVVAERKDTILVPGKYYKVEYRFRQADGTWRWIAAYGRPLFDADEASRAILVVEDISDRKRIEATLRESEERLRLALATARLGVRVHDLVTGKAFSSAEAVEIFGHDEQRDASFEGWFAHVHPDDQPHVRANWDRARADPDADIQQEYRFRKPDGTWRWISAHGTLVFDNGRPVRTIGVIQDITVRKEAEAALAHLAAIVAYSSDAIISKTPAGIILSWNARAAEMFGYTADEMIGEPILKLIPAELRAEEDDILARLAMGERIEHYETVRVTKNGRRIEVSLTISPVYNAAGKIIAASKIARDITQRRVLENELRLLNETLETRVHAEIVAREAAQERAAQAERVQALGQLAGGIAHDFNNVLQAVMGALRLIERRPGDQDSIRRMIGLADGAANRGVSITRRLLSLGRRAELRARRIAGRAAGRAAAVARSARDPDAYAGCADRGKAETGT
jgi:PAS domain S-box-containing protein